MGATTIWERWNSVNPDGYISETGMNSLNHYSYGSVVEWTYRNMCGLRPCEDSPGFKRAVIKPEPDKRFKFAKAEYLSAAGLYKSAWQITDTGEFVFEVTVPFDAEAELILPDALVGKLQGADGLGAEQYGTNVRLKLTAGSYRISYMPEKSYLPGKYGLDTPVVELFKNDRTRAVLNELTRMDFSEQYLTYFNENVTLNDLRKNPMMRQYTRNVDWDLLEEKLSQI